MGKAKRQTVKCETHGYQDVAIVCRHIIEADTAGEPVGFNLCPDVEGQPRPDALCDACRDAIDATLHRGDDPSGEWIMSILRTVCVGCWDRARGMCTIVRH
jgi:hypothetical protein